MYLQLGHKKEVHTEKPPEKVHFVRGPEYKLDTGQPDVCSITANRIRIAAEIPMVRRFRCKQASMVCEEVLQSYQPLSHPRKFCLGDESEVDVAGQGRAHPYFSTVQEKYRE